MSHIHTALHAYMYTRKHAHMYTYTHARTHTRIHAHTHAHTQLVVLLTPSFVFFFSFRAYALQIAVNNLNPTNMNGFVIEALIESAVPSTLPLPVLLARAIPTNASVTIHLITGPRQVRCPGMLNLIMASPLCAQYATAFEELDANPLEVHDAMTPIHHLMQFVNNRTTQVRIFLQTLTISLY